MSVAGALLVAGYAAQLYGQYQSYTSQARALESEAETAEQNAVLAKEDAAFNAERQKFVSEKILAGTKAAYSASGVSTASGSALAVMAAGHINAELDRLSIIHRGDVRSANFLAEAQQKKTAAGDVKSAGEIGLFGTLLQGFGQYGGK